MSTIKSLEELRKIAMNSGEIEKNVKVLIHEIEDKIIMGLQKGLTTVRISIFTYDYQFIACDAHQGIKIVLYNILELLHKKNYTVGVIETKQGYDICIDISKNKKEVELLDAYINKYRCAGPTYNQKK